MAKKLPGSTDIFSVSYNVLLHSWKQLLRRRRCFQLWVPTVEKFRTLGFHSLVIVIQSRDFRRVKQFICDFEYYMGNWNPRSLLKHLSRLIETESHCAYRAEHWGQSYIFVLGKYYSRDESCIVRGIYWLWAFVINSDKGVGVATSIWIPQGNWNS